MAEVDLPQPFIWRSEPSEFIPALPNARELRAGTLITVEQIMLSEGLHRVAQALQSQVQDKITEEFSAMNSLDDQRDWCFNLSHRRAVLQMGKLTIKLYIETETDEVTFPGGNDIFNQQTKRPLMAYPGILVHPPDSPADDLHPDELGQHQELFHCRLELDITPMTGFLISHPESEAIIYWKGIFIWGKPNLPPHCTNPQLTAWEDIVMVGGHFENFKRWAVRELTRTLNIRGEVQIQRVEIFIGELKDYLGVTCCHHVVHMHRIMDVRTAMAALHLSGGSPQVYAPLMWTTLAALAEAELKAAPPGAPSDFWDW